MKNFVSVLVFIFLFVGISHADYYQWEDDQGNLHITDYPPASKSAKSIRVDKSEVEPVSEPGPANQNEAGSSKQESGQQESPKQVSANPESPKQVSSEKMDKKYAKGVFLFSKSQCPYCKRARDYFTLRKISFTEYDIEKDKEAAEKRKQLDSGSGVPFLIINGVKINGFQPELYENALQQNP